MHYVTDAAYAGDYTLDIRFDDGRTKRVDLAPYLEGPVFEPLKDLSFFQRFRVNDDIDTVVWPNDADFSPDFLYSIGLDRDNAIAPTDGVRASKVSGKG